MPQVKKKITARQAKAAATRARMLTAAYELFCQDGFRATTMDAIADRAGVAVQTLYFTFHTKDHLLREVHEWTVLGDDPTPPPLQDWYLAALHEPDARRSLALLVAGVVAIEARVAPMIPVFHAVSADPVGAVYRQGEELRRQGMARAVDMLAAKAPLRTTMSKRRAADLLHVLMGPDSYRSFVLDSGWTPPQWVTWVTATLTHDLFDEPTPFSNPESRPK